MLEDTTTESRNNIQNERSLAAILSPILHLNCVMNNPEVALRAIFFWLGVGNLVPWNAFISAKDYFQNRICVPNSNNEGSSNMMESTFVFVYTLSMVVALGVAVTTPWLRGYLFQSENITISHYDENQLFFGKRKDGRESSSSSFWTVVVPLSLFLVVFLMHAIIVLIVDVSFPNIVKLLTLLSLSICGISSAVAGSGIVAVAGRFESSDLAMNPFLAVRSVYTESIEVMISICNLMFQG